MRKQGLHIVERAERKLYMPKRLFFGQRQQLSQVTKKSHYWLIFFQNN